LTNLGSLTGAIQAYKRRMGIEEMFRDCKSRGYNLEGTGLRGNRLNSMIWVRSLAYLKSTLQGDEINRHQEKNMSVVQKKPGVSIENAVIWCGFRWRKLGKKLEQYHQLTA
jgi:hypothetical protein